MDLFDTHAHFEGSESEIAEQFERAREAGVMRIMAVGGNEALNAGALRAPTPYKAIGWDRDQAARTSLPPLDYDGISAVGEIGLDYYHDAAPRKAQCTLMASQLDHARALDLPVIIHTREADDDTLGLLREIPSRGIIHCFTGSRVFCGKLLDLGFYVSISGIVTFKSAENVRDVARYIPNDRLLIETDSPYLAPVPMRGKPNEPSFLAHTARFLADLRGVPLAALAALTTANATLLFPEVRH